MNARDLVARNCHQRTDELLLEHTAIDIYPAKHFITPQEILAKALEGIEAELNTQLRVFHEQGRLLEAQCIELRTKYGLEKMRDKARALGVNARHIVQDKYE